MQILNYINGKLVPPVSNQWLDNIEPATGKVYSQLAASNAADVDAAVEAARGSFRGWSSTPAEQRARVLNRLADLVERDLEALARAESIDTGKPIALARTLDIPRAVANLRFFAGAVQFTRSESHMTDGPVRGLNYTLRQPLGVVGCISPWNLPLYLFTWKIAPALATGNCVVAKPSELAPMTAFLLGKLAIEAGLPAGVLNIVHGVGAQAGAVIVAHPEVRAITFTGGTKTGAAIATSAGPMFKRLALELGGKNPTIVFADADFEQAVDNSVRAAFANQGEICLCGSRIFVEESLRERFVDEFVERTQRLVQGDPLEETTQQGALISRDHMKKVLDAITLAKREGGDIRTGGNALDSAKLPSRCQGGFFVEPTVITGLSATCRTCQEEIFGPVVTITPFESEDEVVQQVNSVRYGLASSLWTSDLARAHRVAERIEAGTVWINCWLLRDLRVPFGGVKDSGVGREGGEEALRFFTEPKNVCVRISP